MPFDFQGRYVLLTYAQCGSLDPHEIVCLLAGMGAECIVARESHRDEGIHLHALVDFGRRFHTTDERKFDVDGRHPNIQPVKRTPWAVWDYATKDGDVVGGALERPEPAEKIATPVEWSRIADAESVDRFWELVRELAPRALLTNFTSLRAYAEWNYRPVRVPYSTPASIEFDVSGVEELSQWVHANLFGNVSK